VTLIVALAAFVSAVMAAMNKAPIWLPVLLTTVALLLMMLPR
jgi:hypothetical protein